MDIVTTLLILVSLYLVYFDIKYKRVPNLINLALFILVLGNKIYLGDDLIVYLISGAIAFLTFLLIYFVSRGKMGMGDTKYTAIIAFHFGFYFWLQSIIYCSILALIVSLTLLRSKKIDRKTRIAFIPFLVFGWIITLMINIFITNQDQI